jgi:hypothetical protein
MSAENPNLLTFRLPSVENDWLGRVSANFKRIKSRNHPVNYLKNNLNSYYT